MRNRILILAAVAITGCAIQPAPPPAMQAGNTSQPMTVASAALVFDAPITLDQAPLEITRSDRGPAAFVGFEDATINSYDIFSDNRQSTDLSDRFIRESVSERIGTTRR